METTTNTNGLSLNPEQTNELPLQFTGNTREYFGIWIVNILLILLTVGFYTPWAKVRTNRYFYRNTLLDNSPFDYLADPWAILKGWILGIVIFIAYSVSTAVFPLLNLLFMLLLFLLVPVLVVKAMAFRLHNTSYRNLRFSFKKNYAAAFKYFVVWALLLPFTLFLMLPSYIYRQKKFIVNHSRFGSSQFEFKGTEVKFYEIYGIGLLILIGGGLAINMIAGSILVSGDFDFATLSGSSADGEPLPLLQFAMMIPMVVGTGLCYLFFFAYINTLIYNLIWNRSEIAGHTFTSTIKVKSMAWLYLSNGLAIILSFGLLVPWARIRMARYKINHLSLISLGDLGQFIAGETRHQEAFGDQVGDIFDLDIGL